MKIIHKRSDGGVSITVLAHKCSQADAIKHAQNIQDSEPNFISYRIIEDDSLIPSDRYFRNAWTDNNLTETIDIDIEKAQEIKKNKLRELRQPLLEQLDVEYIRALESNNTILLNQISVKKQELRDVTKLLLPENLADLKNFTPSCLK